MTQKWTTADIPDQHGRTAVITGANSGIGFETAATPGAKVAVQQLDLGSLASIRTAAQRLRATHHRIDLLINNAGVNHVPKETTRDGFERQFGTNHLGHFALTGLLLETMLPVAGSRVVIVSALADRTPAGIDFDDLQREQSYRGMAVYSQSKLANLIFAYELHRRLSSEGTTIAVAAHPGLARTSLARNASAPVRAFFTVLGTLIAQSAAMGALPVLRAATDPEVRGGEYYGPGGGRPRGSRGYPRLVESTPQSHDLASQHRLWTISEELTGVRFPV